MKNSVASISHRAVRTALLVAVLGGIAVCMLNAQPAKYVCTPCGLPCDSREFDAPGKCPSCGMPLVTKEEAQRARDAAGPAKSVAILVFDGVQIIDFAGPYEVFGVAGFQVFTVAKTKEPVTTSMGLTIMPRYSFADAPPCEVLVVPGGGVAGVQADSVTISWITQETSRIQHTMSVCNGAFILAHAGLLNGLSATTTSPNIVRLRQQFPKIHVVDDQRFVDNGRIITTGGLSAGIDGALHVVSLMMGEGAAQQVALAEEYEWNPQKPFLRALLADRMIPDIKIPLEFGSWSTERTAGDTSHWEMLIAGTSEKSAGEISQRFEEFFSSSGVWTQLPSASQVKSAWRASSRVGNRTWQGTVAVESVQGQAKRFLVHIKVKRS